MRAVVQRVKKANVSFGNNKNEIGIGLVILLGIGDDDTKEDAKWLSDKIINLRIFPNNAGKFDRSVFEVRGELLVISQFTLFGDASKGRRPDFTKAAKTENAVPLYEGFIEYLKVSELTVKTGEFGADMLVEIHNDGPVTIVLDTKQK